jgi:multidrug efflux system membrane fusion protein
MDGSAAPSLSAPAPAPTPAPPPPQRPHRRKSLIFLGALLAMLLLWEGSGFVFAYTDDAYLLSDLVSIAPQVTGPIQNVAVSDNQFVRRGAPIFTIDPTPFQYELDQAAANEARAQSQIPIDQAALQTAQSLQAAALAQAQQAQSDLRRATDLIHSGFESAQDLEDAQTAGRRAEDALAAAQASVIRAQQTERLHEVDVAASGAARLLAVWRLARTRIVAPVDGRVTHFSLQPGDMALEGRPLVALVAAQGWYVIANYKEGVLRHRHAPFPPRPRPDPGDRRRDRPAPGRSARAAALCRPKRGLDPAAGAPPGALRTSRSAARLRAVHGVGRAHPRHLLIPWPISSARSPVRYGRRWRRSAAAERRRAMR